MAEKKANKTPVKKTTAKKPVAKKPEPKKTENKKVEVKQTVEKVEKKVEAFESKTDKQVDNLVKKAWFVDKIINASWVKEILNLSFMEKANVRVRKNLEKICKVLGILWLIWWCIFAIFAIISFIGWIIALFHGAVWAFLLSIISVVCAALILIISRWLMKMKKWFPAVAIICIAIDIIVLILSIFISWLSFWTELLSLIIWIIFTLFILKNKDMFKN